MTHISSTSSHWPYKPEQKSYLVLRLSYINLTITGVGGYSLLSFLGTSTGQAPFKLGAIVFLIMAYLGTIQLLRKYNKTLKAGPSVFLILALSVLPYSRIFLEVVPTLSLRHITDGLLLIGQYYLLPFSALAILSFQSCAQQSAIETLRRPLATLAIMIFGLALFGYFPIDPNRVVGIYMIYDNLLLPAALFCFSKNRRDKAIGIASLVTIIVLSSMQGSRSYTLVSIYLVFFIILFGGRSSTRKFIVVTIATVFILLVAPIVQSFYFGELNDVMVLKKFRLETLLPTIREALHTGDFISLYFWEGNSRAGIIIDAFGNYSAWDFVFGSGVTATYQSFIARNTIEIGHAQELFWLGLFTVIPTIALTLYTAFTLSSVRSWRRSHMGMIVITILFTRFLDSFIYGLPTLSLYSLLFWMGCMCLALKPAYFAALFSDRT